MNTDINNDINDDINTDINNNLCNGADVAKEARIREDMDLFSYSNINRTCNKVSNNNNISNIKLNNINGINDINDIGLNNVNDARLNKNNFKNNFRLSGKVIYMFINITLPTSTQSTTTKGNVPLSLNSNINLINDYSL